jgi:hypothetical protein
VRVTNRCGTTKLYDRTNDAIMDGISLDEIERILI